MYVLGLNYENHNSAAVLMKNEHIVAASEEERFNRFKYYTGFPISAVNFCLNQAGITIDDIDVITTFHQTISTKIEKIKMFFEMGLYASARDEISCLNKNFQVQSIRYVLEKNGLKGDYNVNFFDHHLCHAASTFFPSGFDDSVIMTSDGRGYLTTATIGQGKKQKIKILKEWKTPYSFGYVYELATRLCGLGPFNEGTTMALASYGNPILKDRINDLMPFIKTHVYFIEAHGRMMPDLNLNPLEMYELTFKKMSQAEREKIEEFKKYKREDIAASVQAWLEEEVKSILKKYYNESDNLCLAGGTFLNCILNSKLRELVEDIFIPPCTHDAGVALGAAILANDGKCEKMQHAFLGPEFSSDYIESILSNKKIYDFTKSKKFGNKIKYEKSDYKHAAELLKKGKIVGWFQGRSEFGPRALGNRSILIDPSRLDLKDRLNKQVKKREPFRPYAPSILQEHFGDYFENPYPSPFMILSFQVKKEKWKEIPTVIHVDGTARVQTVTKEANEKYYNLIDSFRGLTGLPIVLNTSFNLRGEPIVNTPEDALRVFYNTGMDVLFIGEFFVYK